MAHPAQVPLGGIHVLRTFDRIDHVGVFKAANGLGFPLERIALVYAGNGHGKSTLSAILRAASESNAEAISERRSIGQRSLPLVKLTAYNGDTLIHSNGVWRGTPLRSWIFDSDFVERNVHSAGSVQPSHRAGLLDFAIGDSAVRQQAELIQAQSAVTSAKLLLDENEAAILIQVHSADPQCSFEDFERLSVVGDPNPSLFTAESTLVAAQNSARIFAQRMPAAIPTPSLGDPSLADVLATTLDGIHLRARTLVTRHVEALGEGADDAESWIGRGLQLGAGGSLCPFCGQTTDGIELFEMYAHFFNDAYRALRGRIDTFEAAMGPSARERVATQIHSDHQQVVTAITAWRSYIEIPEAPPLAEIDDAIDRFGAALDTLLDGKRERLEVGIGSPEDALLLEALAAAVLAPISQFNESIRSTVGTIEAYKLTLATSNLPTLERARDDARLGTIRRSVLILDLFETRLRLKKEVKRLDRAVTLARTNLKNSMKATLERFEKAINTHLRKLGATFTIEKVASNFKGGGAARSSYALKLKGVAIDVSKGEPPFRLVLSEGDKRTLAFAFFCVTVLAQDDLRGHIVIVDDPVTSLDRSRRSHTTEILDSLSRRGAQVIVMAHDAGYLREVRTKVQKNGLDQDGTVRGITELQLAQDAEGHSTFAAVDLDAECESEFYRNYRRLRCFLDAELFDGMPVSHNDAGTSIRPLVESYLHRRFPGRIPPSKKTLGSIINLIRDSQAGTVLEHAKPLDAELRDLNDFGTRYHHDSSSDSPDPKPDATEVRTYAVRAFDVVHGAAISRLPGR